MGENPVIFTVKHLSYSPNGNSCFLATRWWLDWPMTEPLECVIWNDVMLSWGHHVCLQMWKNNRNKKDSCFLSFQINQVQKLYWPRTWLRCQMMFCTETCTLSFRFFCNIENFTLLYHIHYVFYIHEQEHIPIHT